MTGENTEQGGAPDPAGNDQPAPRTDEEIADNLYDPVKTYGIALKPAFDRHRDATGLSAEESAHDLAAASQFFSDARIPVEEASVLNGILMNHAQQPGWSDTVKDWTTESRRQLREKYGDQAEARLAAVNEFLGRYPGMREVLTKTGVGSHPRVVMAFAEKATKFRAKGK